MNILRCLEQKLFTGKILHDFGRIHDKGSAVSGETHTLLLCRRGGKNLITLRHSYRAVLGFSVSYTILPAELAEALAEKFIEVAAIQKSINQGQA